MKKLLSILLLLSSTCLLSQDWTMYPRHRNVKVKLCCNDRHEFEETMIYFDIDTSYDTHFNSKYDWHFWGAYSMWDSTKTIIYRDYNEKPIWSYDFLKNIYNLSEFNKYYSTSSDSSYMPYVDNLNNYTSWDDTLGSHKLITEYSFMSSIAKINDSISNRYTKLASDLRYKSISYTPSFSEINTALGYTPLAIEVDGSTTNEIELPSQTGHSGKVLTTNGTSPSWTTLTLPTNTNLAGSNVSITKQVFGTVTPTTGNGYSINISGAGLTNLVGYTITPVKNTSTATSVPKIAIKSKSSSAIVVNIIEGNNNTVNILGSLVLLGTSEQFIDVTGLTLDVILYGN